MRLGISSLMHRACQKVLPIYMDSSCRCLQAQQEQHAAIVALLLASYGIQPHLTSDSTYGSTNSHVTAESSHNSQATTLILFDVTVLPFVFGQVSLEPTNCMPQKPRTVAAAGNSSKCQVYTHIYCVCVHICRYRIGHIHIHISRQTIRSGGRKDWETSVRTGLGPAWMAVF